MIYETLGAIGNVLFCWACIAMAWKTIRIGGDIGTPLSTSWTFFIANATFGAYLFGSFGAHWNFAMSVIETVCWLIALYYHYFPRKPPIEERIRSFFRDHGKGGDVYEASAAAIRANLRETTALYADRPVGKAPELAIGYHADGWTGWNGPGLCIREAGHDGPCNGYPNLNCNVWCDKLGRAIPLREHPFFEQDPHDIS